MTQDMNHHIFFLRRPLKLLGLDVLDPSWKVSPLTMITLLIFAVQHYASYSFLTTHLDTFDVFTECFSTSAVGLEVVTRIGLLLHHRDLLNETIETIRNQNKMFGNSEAIQKLTARFHTLVSVTLRTIAAMYLSTIIFELIPIIYPDPKKSNLPLAIFLPYFPHDVAPYWHLNYAFHALLNLLCVCFLVSVDGMVVLSLMAAVYQIKELKVTIQELDTRAERAVLNRELIRIIKIHQSIKHFIRQLEQAYYLDLMVLFGLVCLILCMGLNVIAVEIMHPIGVFLLSVTFQLFLQCFCGNLLLIESDSLWSCVYSIDWHVMPVPEQKLLMVMIAHSQKPQFLRAIFMPLVMSSFMSVMKASYSYFTLLH